MKGISINFNALEVGIIENDPMNANGLKESLEQLGCRVVWTARNEEEAQEAAAMLMPAVAFVDLRLLRRSDDYQPGWQLIKHLHQVGQNRRFAIIIFSGTPMTDEIVLEAMRMGCSYVVKEDLMGHEKEIIAGALLAAQSGSVLLSNEVASGIETLVSRNQTSDLLSDTEWEVLRLVADGLTNSEIAKRQFVAVSTIKSHVSSILAKLEVSNRTQAAEWFRQNGRS